MVPGGIHILKESSLEPIKWQQSKVVLSVVLVAIFMFMDYVV